MTAADETVELTATEKLWAKIEQQRVKMGIDKTAFAGMAGSQRQNYLRWIEGVTQCHLATFVRFAELAGYEVRLVRSKDKAQ